MFLKDICLDIYNYMYLSKLNKSYFVKANDKKLIIDFLIEVHKNIGLESIGVNYIYNYIGYQYLHHLNTNKNPNISSVFGNKAVTRYFKNLRNINLFILDIELNKINVNRSYCSKFNRGGNIDKNEEFGNDYEELERKRYLNKPNGFINCFEKTTLFNNKSITCLKCNERTDCKNILKEHYPNIYYERFKKTI